MSPRSPRKPAAALATLRAAVDVRKSTRGEWRLALLIAVVLATLMAAGDHATSFLAFGATFVGALVCALVFVIKNLTSAPAAARGALLILLALVASVLGMVVGRRHFRAASRARGDTIAAALDRYAAREGAYPRSLEDLLPHDLSEIPATAFGIFRAQPFDYRSSGNDYHLSVRVDLLADDVRTATTGWKYRD